MKYKLLTSVMRILSTLGICIALYGLIPLTSGLAISTNQILCIIFGLLLSVACFVGSALVGAKQAKDKIAEMNKAKTENASANQNAETIQSNEATQDALEKETKTEQN